MGNIDIQKQLKEQLLQLKTAIETDSILNENDRTDALNELSKIAQLAQSTNHKQAVKRSLLALQGIILSIGEVTHLTETAKPQLDAIAHLFKL